MVYLFSFLKMMKIKHILSVLPAILNKTILSNQKARCKTPAGVRDYTDALITSRHKYR